MFEIDTAHCPNCGGELKIIAAILEQPVIEKILTHLVGSDGGVVVRDLANGGLSTKGNRQPGPGSAHSSLPRAGVPVQ